MSQIHWFRFCHEAEFLQLNIFFMEFPQVLLINNKHRTRIDAIKLLLQVTWIGFTKVNNLEELTRWIHSFSFSSIFFTQNTRQVFFFGIPSFLFINGKLMETNGAAVSLRSTKEKRWDRVIKTRVVVCYDVYWSTLFYRKLHIGGHVLSALSTMDWPVYFVNNILKK